MAGSDRIGIYIHLPFCIRKCNYCDFLSASMSSQQQERYVQALLAEIRYKGERLNKVWGNGNARDEAAASVFIGGGTPSVVEPLYIKEILFQLKQSFNISADAEITIEANPGTLDERKLDIYLEAGINRLSLGVQSANDYELKLLGRIHSFEEFEKNYILARSAGFKNINTDLMFGIPGQTFASFKDTLDIITKLKPEHVSAYSLIVEEGTPFYELYGETHVNKRKESKGDSSLPKLPDEDTERDMYHFACRYLNDCGYGQYEISNFAREGYESSHNILYWKRGEYAGFGLGAASLVNEIRYKNVSDFNKYVGLFETCSESKMAESDEIKKAGPDEIDELDMYEENTELSYSDRMAEFMFLGLRMTKGIRKEDFKECFGRDIYDVYGTVLDKYKSLGLLNETDSNIYLTPAGIDVSNVVFSEFIL